MKNIITKVLGEKKILHIFWRDSSMYHQQGDNDYPFEVSKFETVGYLIQENTDSLVIARDIIRDESRSVIIIPKENILSTIELVVKQPEPNGKSKKLKL